MGLELEMSWLTMKKNWCCKLSTSLCWPFNNLQDLSWAKTGNRTHNGSRMWHWDRGPDFSWPMVDMLGSMWGHQLRGACGGRQTLTARELRRADTPYRTWAAHYHSLGIFCSSERAVPVLGSGVPPVPVPRLCHEPSLRGREGRVLGPTCQTVSGRTCSNVKKPMVKHFSTV